MVDAEGAISELKNEGTLARAQRRGTPRFHVQLLLGCTAVNCKRLADHAPQAQSAAVAESQKAAAQDSTAAAATAHAQTAPADTSRWLAALLTAPVSILNYAISLN